MSGEVEASDPSQWLIVPSAGAMQGFTDWLAAHDQALRESIAAEIEALPELSQTPGYEALYRKGIEHAARICRGTK